MICLCFIPVYEKWHKIQNNQLMKKLSKHFKDKIKFSFIAKENFIIVTKNDKVYQFDELVNKTYSSIAYISDESKVKELINLFSILINYWKIRYQSFKGNSTQIEMDSIKNKELLENRREFQNAKEFGHEVDKIMNFGEKFIRNGYYEGNFDELYQLSQGRYGRVYEVCFKNQVHKSYVVKKITLYLENNLENLFQTLGFYDSISKLKNKNIVSTEDFWFEKDVRFNEKLINFYILMELCQLNLDCFINQLEMAPFSSYLKYYLSSVIFIQLLRGVDYFHKQYPQIIHRDLNPYNILLKLEVNNRVIVKIADFESITVHKYAEQWDEPDVGRAKYMAPEVVYYGKYDTRADIYSLGIVLGELFDIYSFFDEEYVFRFFLFIICI